MMQKIERLLDLAIAYLEQNVDTAGLPAAAAPAESAAPRRARKAKEQAAPAAPTEPVEFLPQIEQLPVSALMSEQFKKPVAELTETESSKDVYAVCAAYVQRFSKSKPDGRTVAIEMLAEKFKVKSIAELGHPQRLAFITALKVQLAKAEAVN